MVQKQQEGSLRQTLPISSLISSKKPDIEVSEEDLGNLTKCSKLDSDLILEHLCKIEEDINVTVEVKNTSMMKLLPPAEYFESRAINCFIVCYDTTDRSSFENIDVHFNILERCEFYFQVIIVGTKADLKEKREVTEAEGLQLADDYDCAFFETSAKDMSNISNAFTILVLSWICKMKQLSIENQYWFQK
ncbi:unnamed protein product [Moneuplotes crassus]|uniref:small monomeric GTPase n=1 Tax=Euplotes crassus TaxID=5936 RepID=A0AAD1XT65_EUPCR|nr:unnamed protein product [Moneuplotes crassus]